MNLPNTISLMRLLCVPVAIWLIVTDDFAAAFWLFVLAGVSDAVDGVLARRWGWRTKLGSYLDPLADKALVVSVYVTLGLHQHLPAWLVILVVFRDMVIIGGAMLQYAFTANLPRIKPLMISKLNTVAQILLAGLTLAMLGLGARDFGLATLLIYGVALTTLFSGLVYGRQWLRTFARVEDQP
ncbi:MAG: CDP-alcohol phosphatidyltransferase family protein [Alphaproteobacteria bacterium]|nr:CDP-alcohol phosphatidyltransferase family protein [Alphaproteobacteria bacterium]